MAHTHAAILTAVLWLALLFGMPTSAYWVARRFGGETGRIRRTTGSLVPRRPRPITARVSRAEPVHRRARAAGVALLVAVALLTVAMWVGVPLGWLWVFSQMLDSTQPTMWPYVLMTFTIPASMFAIAHLILRIAAVRAGVLRRPEGARPNRAKWLRSLRDDRPSVAEADALDIVLAVAVVASIVALLIWIFVLADPSSMLPTELRGG